jgi:hypothetical protein
MDHDRLECAAPQRIRDHLAQLFAWEPADEITAQAMRDWLGQAYPDVRWQVRMVHKDIEIRMLFDTPEELSWFLLKNN